MFDYYQNKDKPFSVQQKEFNEALEKANAGNMEAKRTVSIMYENGYGCEKSLINGAMWREQWKIDYSKMTGQPIQNHCFITTAVCGSFGKPDDCYELTTFRKFRDTWLSVQPDGKSLIAEYYAIAPKIIENINRLSNAAQIYQSIWQKYLEPCLNFIRNSDNLACKNKYIEMVGDLKKKYL